MQQISQGNSYWNLLKLRQTCQLCVRRRSYVKVHRGNHAMEIPPPFPLTERLKLISSMIAI